MKLYSQQVQRLWVLVLVLGQRLVLVLVQQL